MATKDQFLKTFRGYPDWDDDTKAEALKVLLSEYIKQYDLFTDSSKFIEVLEQHVFEDIQDYQDREEYEICTILRDLLDIL